MHLFTYEFISIIILFVVAIKEYELLYAYSGKQIPKTYTDKNSNVIEMAVKVIFNKDLKWGKGEFIVFMYPITFILIGLNTILYIYLNGYENIEYLQEFIIITAIIIGLHVIVPYYFTYIKYYEESLRKNVPFKDWLLIAVTMILRNDKEIFIIEDTKTKKVILNKNYTQFDYEKYLIDFLLIKDYLISENIDYEIEPLNNEKFTEYLKFYTNYNFFVFSNKTNSEIELFLDNDNLEITNVETGLTKMHNSLFSKIDLNIIFLSRFVEIIMYFGIINIIIELNKGVN